MQKERKLYYFSRVESMALLTDGKEVIDWDYKDFAAEMWVRRS